MGALRASIGPRGSDRELGQGGLDCVPYAAAAMAGLIGMVLLIGWDAGAGITGTVPHSKSVNYVLSVLPMFILIGFIAYHAGLTHALFNAARAWFGWVPGGYLWLGALMIVLASLALMRQEARLVAA